MASLVAIAIGCSAEAAPSLADDDAADFVQVSRLWQSPQIAVCWEFPDPAFADERAWVEDAIRSTWDRVSAIEVTGFARCQPGERGVHLTVSDDSPHTLGIGSDLDGMASGMSLNFTFLNWSTTCQNNREFCIRAGAVHEFGHVIGFVHEQNRPDTPPTCNDVQGFNGEVSLGAWDLDSVMNYCNPRWTGDGKLSAGDIRAVRALYGRPPGDIVAARSSGDRFEQAWEASTLPAEQTLVGDVDGDGRAEVVRIAAGSWDVFGDGAKGATFLGSWATGFGSASSVALLADVTGDGRADAISVDAGTWRVAASTGQFFAAAQIWIEGHGGEPGTLFAADVTGDKRADAIAWLSGPGQWWRAVAGDGKFGAPELAASIGSGTTARPLVGDATGDGLADAILVDAGRWRVAAATPTGFADTAIWIEQHGELASDHLVADVSGDGRADAVVFEKQPGRWFTAGSTGTGFGDDLLAAEALGEAWGKIAVSVQSGDLDGDGRADLILTW